MQGYDSLVVQAVLDDWRSAPVSEQMRATLGYLEKLVSPEVTVDAADIAPMNIAGVSRIGMEEATLIALVYQTICRLADALDFNLTPEENLSSSGKFLYQFGYTTSSLPG
ncbi:MAG: hypothetical protein AAF702_27165 [Chloroflexota bacterium]